MLCPVARRTLLVFGLCFLVPANVRAQEPKSAVTARLLMQVIDTVQAHHIDPPTRQQMVLDAIRQIANQNQKLLSTGLSREISSADPDTLETLLVRELSVLLQDGGTPTKIQDLPLEVTDFLRGNNISVESQQEHRVQEQIAGNRYVGIGIAAGMYQPTNRMQVLKVEPGGAAFNAGVQKDDIVESVDGKSTAGESLAQVIQRLRGEEGTDVTVTVRQPDADKPREYTMTRGIVPFKTVKDPGYSSDKTVAAIGFQRLTGSTVHELRKIEAELPETIEAVSLDFRSLSGRNLHHGILIASALLDGTPIGQIETTEGTRAVTAEPGALFGDRKLIIMINASTQGTALWIAAAVQRADPGNHVHGDFIADGLVFDAVPLPGTELVVTMPTARLRRVDGIPLGSSELMPSGAFPTVMMRPPPSGFGARREVPLIQPASRRFNSEHLLGAPFKRLAEEVSEFLSRESDTDEPKE